jgi:hypothetical protein
VNASVMAADSYRAAGLDVRIASPSFSIEDTSDRCYRDIVYSLNRKGWRRLQTRKRLPEKKRSFRIPFMNLLLSSSGNCNSEELVYISLLSQQRDYLKTMLIDRLEFIL